MKRMYDFGRAPSKRNYTCADLRELKGSDSQLSMANPSNPTEIKACVEAGIDLMVIWAEQLEEARQVAPHHFMGVGSTWAQLGTDDEILSHAVDLMGRGADMYYTLRSFDLMEKLANEGIPVQSHIGLIPTFSHWSGGLRAYGRTADEAIQIFRTLKRMESVGVFAVEVECIAEEVLTAVNDKTSIVTFSLGSGRGGDAVFSFVTDVCGEDSEEDTPPRHAHAFDNLAPLHQEIYERRVKALRAFHEETVAAKFPYDANNISMQENEHEKFLDLLDKE